MKPLFLLLFALSLMIVSLCGDIVFDDPIAFFESENLSLSREIKELPGGNLLLIFSKHLQGVSVPHIQVFTADYQPVWETAIPVPKLVDAAIHTDGKIAVVREGAYSYDDFILDTYSPAGDLIQGLSGITHFESYYVNLARLATDNAGGLHFLKCSTGTVRYMYVNNQGNLLTPQYGLEILQQSYSTPSSFYPTSDGGALIAIPRSGGFTVFKIGANHQVAWSTGFETPGDILNLTLHLRDNNSFYVVWNKYFEAYANLVSSTGQKLWAEDLTPIGGPIPLIEGSGVDQAGNLILHYHARELLFQMEGQHCLQVINAQGETVYSHIPGLDTSLSNPMKMRIFPQSNGGWFVLATKDEEQVVPAHYIQYYDSSFQPLQEPVLVSNQYNYSIFGYLMNNELAVTYLHEEQDMSYIVAQRVDTGGNLQYPEPGTIMSSGIRGTATQINALPLSNGALFVAWVQSYPGNEGRLMYQVISPSGASYFPLAQELNSTRVAHYSIFETNSSEVLVVWDSGSGYNACSRAQLISLSQGNLWEQGGRLLRQGNESHKYSYWNNSLYLASYSFNGGIYMHRYDFGYQIWGPGGVLVADYHPDYANSWFNLVYMSGNQICWHQGDGDTVQMTFTNFFFEDGSTLYPPNQAAQTTASLPDPYVGAYISGVHKSGTDMIYIMQYQYWAFVHDGHSDPGYWTLRSDRYVQRVNPDGSPLGASISCPYDMLLFHNGSFFYIDGNSGVIHSLPLYGGSDGIIQLQQGWSVDQLTSLSNQRILVNAKVNMNVGFLEQHFAFIDQNGTPEYWAQSEISDIPIQRTYVSNTGAWYLLCPQDLYTPATGAYLQLLEWQSSGSNDPNEPPAVPISLTNYPNPFSKETRVCVILDEATPLTLKIYNLRGQLVRTIQQDEAVKGNNYLIWDGKDSSKRGCATGIYFLKAETAHADATLRTLMIR
jgi:hypothetical protein